MKKIQIFILILILLPLYCFAEIIPIPIPIEISNAEQVQVLKLLRNIYKDTIIGIDQKTKKISSKEPFYYEYIGFFATANLLKNRDSVKLFLYSKDSDCSACHDAGIALVNKDNEIIDSIQTGSLNISLISYNNKNTCVILSERYSEGGGGSTHICEIFRLNPRKKFEKIYSKKLVMGFEYGQDMYIKVTETAINNTGYRNIVVKEYLKAHPVPVFFEANDISSVDTGNINQEITINIKKIEDADMMNGIKEFFGNFLKGKAK